VLGHENDQHKAVLVSVTDVFARLFTPVTSNAAASCTKLLAAWFAAAHFQVA
jgi:hypothetical protein